MAILFMLWSSKNLEISLMKIDIVLNGVKFFMDVRLLQTAETTDQDADFRGQRGNIFRWRWLIGEWA
jgi:hypothetical protein